MKRLQWDYNNIIDYKREGCELTGKLGTTIGASDDLEDLLLLFFLSSEATFFLLSEAWGDDDGDDGEGAKQLHKEERRAIDLIGRKRREELEEWVALRWWGIKWHLYNMYTSIDNSLVNTWRASTLSLDQAKVFLLLF